MKRPLSQKYRIEIVLYVDEEKEADKLYDFVAEEYEHWMGSAQPDDSGSWKDVEVDEDGNMIDLPIEIKDTYFRCCGSPQDMGHMFGCPKSVERQPKERTESDRGISLRKDKVES